MGGGEEFVVVNYYNRCQRLENDKIVRSEERRVGKEC